MNASSEENITENTFIEPNLEMSAIRSDPFTLPQPFVWSEVDILNDEQLSELYTLLTENYVEDDENMFRFDYSREFLRWYATSGRGWTEVTGQFQGAATAWLAEEVARGCACQPSG